MEAMKDLRDTFRRVGLLATLVLLGAISCSPDLDPVAPEAPSTGDGLLAIQTEKESYTLDEVNRYGGIEASLVNPSDQLFHSALGDGFDAAVEQHDLSVAEGSHAYLEQWVAFRGWRSIPRGQMYEGVRLIEIRPHGSYRLVAVRHHPWTAGRFRLRVEFFDSAENPAGQVPHVDTSNTFTIR